MHVTNLKCPTKAKSNYSSSIVVNADLNHNHENDERKNERRFISVDEKEGYKKIYLQDHQRLSVGFFMTWINQICNQQI